jgi:hypothetical protein
MRTAIFIIFFLDSLTAKAYFVFFLGSVAGRPIINSSKFSSYGLIPRVLDITVRTLVRNHSIMLSVYR